MNANTHPRALQWGRAGRPRRQLGGETVEFALFLAPFFLLCFIIIDMAIVLFNQNVVNHAARYGARQGTLYWVDPDPNEYDPNDPLANIRVKEEMIVSAIDYYVDNVLINPGGDAVDDGQIDLPGATLKDGAHPNRVWWDVANASATVSLSYPHDFIGISRLLGLTGLTLGADTALFTESDL